MRLFKKLGFLAIFFYYSQCVLGQLLPIDYQMPGQSVLDPPALSYDFQLLPAPFLADDYQPQLSGDYRIPIGLPENVQYPTGILGNLTALLDRQTTLRKAIDDFLIKDFSSARKNFLKAATTADNTGKTALLWLCYLDILMENFSSAKAILKELKSDQKYLIASEAYYLEILAHFIAGDYSQVVRSYKQWQGQSRFKLDSFKIEYLAFLSFLALEDEQKALSLGDHILKNYQHSLWYPYLLEALADLNFSIGQHQISAELYLIIKENFTKYPALSHVNFKFLWTLAIAKEYETLKVELGDYYSKQGKDAVRFDYFDFLIWLYAKDYQAAWRSYQKIPSSSALKPVATLKLAQSYDLLKSGVVDVSAVFDVNASGQELLYYNFAKSYLYFWQGKHDLATQILEKQLVIKNISPKMKDALRYNLGQALLAAGKYEEALLNLNPALYENKPQGLGYYNCLAWYELGDFKSILAAKESNFFVTRSLTSDVMLAYAYAADQQEKRALDVISRLFREADNVESLKYALDLAGKLSNYEYGQILLNQAESRRISLDLTFHQARYLVQQGKYEEAQHYLDLASPDNDQAEDELTILKLQVKLAQGDYESVIATFSDWLQGEHSPPTEARYNFLLAEAYFKSGAYYQSELHYQTALQSASEQNLKSLALYNKLKSIQFQEQGARFYLELQEALQSDLPTGAQRLFIKELADYYLSDSGYDKARSIYLDYLKFYDDDTNFIAQSMLATAFKTGHWNECLDDAAKLLEDRPSTAKIDNWLLGSRCALKLKDFDWIMTNHERLATSDYKGYEQSVVLALTNLEAGALKSARSSLKNISSEQKHSEYTIIHDFVSAKLNFLTAEKTKERVILQNPTLRRADYQRAGIYAEALYLYSKFLARQQKHSQAVKFLLRAIYHDDNIPYKASDYLYLAELLSESDYNKDAFKVAQKITDTELSAAERERLSRLLAETNSR